MIGTGGSEIWNKNLTVEILRSNLTGAGNAITVPVEKRVEGVCDGMLFSRKATGFLMRYNYRRGMQSTLIKEAWQSGRLR